MARNTAHYAGALNEEINERLKLVQEALGAMKNVPADIKQIKEDVAELKDGFVTFKASLKNHERRITKLETA